MSEQYQDELSGTEIANYFRQIVSHIQILLKCDTETAIEHIKIHMPEVWEKYKISQN